MGTLIVVGLIMYICYRKGCKDYYPRGYNEGYKDGQRDLIINRGNIDEFNVTHRSETGRGSDVVG